MTKKAKKVKSQEKLSLENIKVGDKILDLHNEEIEITDELIKQMKQYEKETKKSVIWRGKLTGSFLYFKLMEEQPKKKKKSKKPKIEEEEIEDEEFDEELEEMEQGIEEVIEESLDKEMESQVEDEENLLLDAMEDYKAEYNVKKVNTNTNKWKKFFEEWKQV